MSGEHSDGGQAESSSSNKWNGTFLEFRTNFSLVDLIIGRFLSFLFAWLYRNNIESVRDSLVTYPIDISLIIRSWWWSWNMTQKLDIVPGSNHRRRWQRQQYDVMNSILWVSEGSKRMHSKTEHHLLYFSAKVGTQNWIDEKSRVLSHNSPIHRRKKEKNCSMKTSAECRAADRSSESDAMCLFNLLKLHYDSLPCLCPIQHTYFFSGDINRLLFTLFANIMPSSVSLFACNHISHTYLA